jgi:hypothetical protein
MALVFAKVHKSFNFMPWLQLTRRMWYAPPLAEVGGFLRTLPVAQAAAYEAAISPRGIVTVSLGHKGEKLLAT